MYDCGSHGDQVPYDDVYSLDYTIDTSKSAGIYEFKIFVCTTWNGYPGEESSNKFVYVGTPGQVVKFTMDTTTPGDGYLPASYIVHVDSNDAWCESQTWVVAGSFQGWINNDSSSRMISQGGGIFKLTRTIDAAGTYQYRITIWGSWAQQFGPDGYSINPGNASFTTTVANQTVEFYLNVRRPGIKAVVLD